ncbi:GGDEF domain-containing protein [Salipaludibacillus aurantiacus]|uniref:Diguanylate cyclase (GGDEF) domain-containing protein n=1 Tax=Salipaludibacillus aurantiacus TaxID=1601833 RepID=A0A1H9U7D9_9BACI|nr:GGDEF domain-containing protein [Salipaludibacillus aurantiacus]SES05181.1 diguanylate cyclase (GGDEF) domain-containing protein [Salipaludibacillus aurantiacus]
MDISGRIFSLLLVIVIQTAYILYYFYRDGFISIGGWLGYPILLPIGYWTGYQFDKARFYSQKDSLTGLYNRRYIQQNFSKYIKKANRNNYKLFVLLLDCDNFKKINDTWGHSAGDLVLIKIAKMLMQYNNKVYASARWGGDEFIIIGACHNDEEIDRFTRDLQQQLADLIIPEIKQSVSVSIGSSIQQPGKTDIRDLIKEADDNMYENKNSKKYPAHR